MQNKQFAGLMLFTAILFGLIIRLSAPMNAQGPVNDGGLFLQMTSDLQANGFMPPRYTTYNDGTIPFAYPPLGFYLIGFIQQITGFSLMTLFTWLPALFSALVIPATYFLALELTHDSLKASIAALFYAVIPRSFDWFVMGGGAIRALGILFSFLALLYVHRLFTTRQPKFIVYVSLFTALAILSHPRAAFHAVVTCLIFAVFFIRSWKSVIHALIAGAGSVLLTAPWWFPVLQLHGMEVFQAAFSAEPRNYLNLFLAFVQFTLAGEVLLTVVSILALIGVVQNIRARNYFLPVWILVGGHVISIAALALLAVWGLEVVLKGLGDSTGLVSSGESPRWSRYTVLGISTYLLMGGIIASAGYGYSFRLLPGELDAMHWAGKNVPEASRFLLITGDVSMVDPLSEWFPVYADQISVTTIQGHEWTPEQDLQASIRKNDRLQACLMRYEECLSGWDFDYVYIRKVKPMREGEIVPRLSFLDESLRVSSHYQIVFENAEAVIYRPIR